MTAEQEALFRRAQDHLDLARAALDLNKPFAAVSNAYYAMFNVARCMLLAEAVDASSHAAVISAFGQRFAKTGRVPTQLHRVLIEAERARVTADYRPLQSVSKQRAEELIAYAEQFVALAREMLGLAAGVDQETP